MSLTKSKKKRHDERKTDEFDSKLHEISSKISTLRTSSNIDEIIKQRELIQSEIDLLHTELTELENKIPREKSNESTESDESSNENSLDSDFNFGECFESIHSIQKKILTGDLSLRDQIKKYIILERKISQCTQYMEAQKMSIVHIQNKN